MEFLRTNSPSFANWIAYWITYFVGSLGLGIASSVFAERRILAWRDEVMPSRSQSIPSRAGGS